MKEIKLNEKAVSPVIATILMVAITVVLSGVLYVWASQLAEGNTDGDFSMYDFTVSESNQQFTTAAGEEIAYMSLDSGEGMSWATVIVQVSTQNGPYLECTNPDKAVDTGCAVVDNGDGSWAFGEEVIIKEGTSDLCDGVGVCTVQVKVLDRSTNKLIYESSQNSFSGGSNNAGGGSTASTYDCGDATSVKIAGSSTVLPLAEIWAENYKDICPDTTITVEGGGSSAGAGRVCANSAKGTPVDIGDMSRNWKSSEATEGNNGIWSCLKGDTSITVTQLQVAVDGLSVVFKKGGNADTCVNTHLGGLTVAQLRWIFSAEADSGYTPSNDDGDNTKEWSDLSADCADIGIPIKYPDADSGTYDYFYDVILDYASEGFRSGTQSADDNVLVNALLGDGNAIGYFGYAYYEENQATLSAAPVENSNGDMVTPGATTVRDGSYNPLSRSLYMNINNDNWDTVGPFIDWAFSNDGQNLVSNVGYVPLNSQDLATMKSRIAAEGN